MSTVAKPTPRHVVAKAIVLASGSLLLSAALLAWGPSTASGWNQSSAEATLWQLMNGARVNNGLAPVQSHGTLVSLARWRSRDMIERDYFSHTILGTGCDVYCYYDSNGLSYAWGGENIAWNSGRTDDYSPVRAHEMFMGSSGHRANVLNPAFTHGGVGAWAADNVSYQGSVQSPRMFTELFLQAHVAAAPAAPPPTGGGGGGPAPAAPQPPPPPAPVEPTPATVDVGAVARPVSTAGLDGVAEAVVEVEASDVAARLAADDALSVRHGNETTAVATPSGMRVEAAQPADHPDLFSSIFGALVGALFG